jgi:hypothetical protein
MKSQDLMQLCAALAIGGVVMVAIFIFIPIAQ